MQGREFDVVTGAFGYTGKYITRRLLAMGRGVRTLTGHPERAASSNGNIEVAPLQFDRPKELVESLRGASTFYNTYWVRFPHGAITYEKAVENTRILIEAAREAGVQRIVHISITNPSPDSNLGYFRGKAAIERLIIDSGLAYAILRPTVTFGVEDVLINNIAWLLRHCPIFAIPGSGEYRLQPVFVVDVAEMAVAAGRESGNLVMDAVGPEIYTFEELVHLIAGKVGSRAKILHVPPALALLLSSLVGRVVHDVVLTKEEVEGLMAGLLVSKDPPTGRTRLSEWASRHAHLLGTRYTSELNRHFGRKAFTTEATEVTEGASRKNIA
ncbi:MAG: NAD(P)H-binding protein [Terriglobia bacterium]|jgi:NADH dehydrogenase